MSTFVFVLAISIATPTEEAMTQFVVDHSLTVEDCMVLLDAYEPTRVDLPNGVTIWTSPICELEVEHD